MIIHNFAKCINYKITVFEYFNQYFITHSWNSLHYFFRQSRVERITITILMAYNKINHKT